MHNSKLGSCAVSIHAASDFTLSMQEMIEKPHFELCNSRSLNIPTSYGGKLITHPNPSFYRFALIFERLTNLVSH